MLDGANLAGAYLGDASLVQARLVGADLSDAALTRANLRGADLTDAKYTKGATSGTSFIEARFDAFTKLPAELDPWRTRMVFVVGADRVDEARTGTRAGVTMLANAELETGGTLVIKGDSTLHGRRSIMGNGTLLVTDGSRLLQQGSIEGQGIDGLWLLGRVEGRGPLKGRINVMDTLARDGRASFEDLWLAPTARLELLAKDWRNGPLFNGSDEYLGNGLTADSRAWLDGVLSVDFTGANLVDGDRLVLIAAHTIGGRFDSTDWRGLANGTQLALALDSSPGRMQLVVAVSVTAVPEPATQLLAALGGLGLAAWMRRRRGRAEDRAAEGGYHP